MPVTTPSDLQWANPDWMSGAACANAPLQETSSVEAAIAVCQRCTVIGPCLSFALTRDETYGVWGGLTYDDRKRLQRSSSTTTAAG